MAIEAIQRPILFGRTNVLFEGFHRTFQVKLVTPTHHGVARLELDALKLTQPVKLVTPYNFRSMTICMRRPKRINLPLQYVVRKGDMYCV